MRDKIADLWLSFLLITRIKKMDFRVEVSPPELSYDCCGPNSLCIVAEYRWFWQKSSPTTIAHLCDEA